VRATNAKNILNNDNNPSVISAVVPTGTMLAYGSNDQNDNNQNDNDPRNQACYNAGFGDGRQNNP
jgi:hypothetical protein